jgi:hypothetical protein
VRLNPGDFSYSTRMAAETQADRCRNEHVAKFPERVDTSGKDGSGCEVLEALSTDSSILGRFNGCFKIVPVRVEG